MRGYVRIDFDAASTLRSRWGEVRHPHVPISFFLPFCLLFLDVDVDAVVAVDADTVDAVDADAVDVDAMDPVDAVDNGRVHAGRPSALSLGRRRRPHGLVTRTPTAAYVGEDRRRSRGGEVHHTTSQ